MQKSFQCDQLKVTQPTQNQLICCEFVNVVRRFKRVSPSIFSEFNQS